MKIIARTGFGLIAGCCAAALVGTASPCHADTVTLKNGREIHGRLVEEKKDSIRIRTSGGTITISKIEVATFSENENWGDYGLKPSTIRGMDAAPKVGEGEKPVEGEGSTEEGEKPTEGEKPKDKEGQVGKQTFDVELILKEWKWPGDLSDEEIEGLTKLRDRVITELKKVGPTKEQRLAAVKLEGEEATLLKDQINAFSRKRRRGSANQLRKNAMGKIVKEFGIKAIDQLAQALGSSNQWIQRMSAQTLSEIAGSSAKADDAKWYLHHFNVPEKLLKLFDHQGDVDSPFIRDEANTALKRVFGKEFGFKATTEALRTPPETAAYKKWEGYVKNQAGVWARAQKGSDTLRSQLLGMLDTLRKGEPIEERKLEEAVAAAQSAG